ncbi:hypothetical protein B0H11DRAFT_1941097 [Mycena galericulata]|nr:hypothetical protein B0H11DRAFT_1941097 [Mycena galericulata]
MSKYFWTLYFWCACQGLTFFGFAHSFDQTAMATSSLQYRCEVPYFPDPGQPATPGAMQKLYLVTGGDPATAGAYATWNTAGPNSQGVSARAVKARSPPCLGSVGLLGSTSLLWTPSSAPVPSTPKPGARKISIFSEDTPRAPPGSVLAPGVKSYAVRSGTEGWVYGDLDDVRTQFHSLQSSVRRVEMEIANGFTRAVAFAEGGAPADDTPEGRRRKEWAAQERRAFRVRQAAEEQWALEEERARTAYQEHIVDELQYYREDDSGSTTAKTTPAVSTLLTARMVVARPTISSKNSTCASRTAASGGALTSDPNKQYIERNPNKMSAKSTKKLWGLRKGVRRDVLENVYADMQEWAIHKKVLAAKKPGPATECYWHELGCDLCKKNKSTARTF